MNIGKLKDSIYVFGFTAEVGRRRGGFRLFFAGVLQW